MNSSGASAKPMFVYESFARSRSQPASVIASWSNAIRGRSSTGCQAVSGGHARVDADRDEPEVRRRELALARVALGLAARLELLEVRERADVDLRGEVPADRLLQRLVALEIAAGERPRGRERLARALPQQHLQPPVPDLEDDGERDMGGRAIVRHQVFDRRHKPT